MLPSCFSSSCPGNNQKMPPSQSGGGGLRAAASLRKLTPRPAAQQQLVALHPALGPHPPGCHMPAPCCRFSPLLRLPSDPGSSVCSPSSVLSLFPLDLSPSTCPSRAFGLKPMQLPQAPWCLDAPSLMPLLMGYAQGLSTELSFLPVRTDTSGPGGVQTTRYLGSAR